MTFCSAFPVQSSDPMWSQQSAQETVFPLSSYKTWEKKNKKSPRQRRNLWWSSPPFKWGFSESRWKIKTTRQNTQTGNFHFHYNAKLPAVSQFVWLRLSRLIASEVEAECQNCQQTAATFTELMINIFIRRRRFLLSALVQRDTIIPLRAAACKQFQSIWTV